MSLNHFKSVDKGIREKLEIGATRLAVENGDGKKTEFRAVASGVFGDALTSDGMGGVFWSPASAGSTTATDIIYVPGGVTSENVYSTWAEIVAVVSSSTRPFNIYVDDRTITPAPISSDLDCEGRITFYPLINSSSSAQLKFNNDVQLTDPRGFSGSLNVICDCSSQPNIVFTPGNIIFVTEGAHLSLAATCSFSPIVINDNDGLIFAFFTGYLNNSLSPFTPFVQMGINSTLIWPVQSMSNPFSNNVFAGPISSSIIKLFDSSASENFITNSGFLGSAPYFPYDNALATSYDDTIAVPTTGATTVQGALDLYKQFAFSIGTNYSDYLYWDPVATRWNVGGIDIHIGAGAGQNQPVNGGSVAIGQFAGFNQLSQSVAIGVAAGGTPSGDQTTAVGYQSGFSGQGLYATALGTNAGGSNQAGGTLAVGAFAGAIDQGEGAIAIGSGAGTTSQGAYSIAMGYNAGSVSMPKNSLIIAAGSSSPSAIDNDATYIGPMRSPGGIPPGFQQMYYNPTTYELIYV